MSVTYENHTWALNSLLKPVYQVFINEKSTVELVAQVCG